MTAKSVPLVPAIASFVHCSKGSASGSGGCSTAGASDLRGGLGAGDAGAGLGDGDGLAGGGEAVETGTTVVSTSAGVSSELGFSSAG